MITLNIYYKGVDGAVKNFVDDMVESKTVEKIRSNPGNLRYQYFYPVDDPDTILLIDSWESQEAIDTHHASPMMDTIAKLREKHMITMEVERYISDEIPDSDKKFIVE